MGMAPGQKKRGRSFSAAMRDMKTHALFFLESTSIRGCNRIVKTDSKPLRLLWALYICLTTLFLSFSIIKLINEYREYSVNIQTYISMDEPMDFPAVTFCNHQPFSSEAYELWRSRQVISPTGFNQLLRNRAAKLLEKAFEFPSNGENNMRFVNASLIREALIQGLTYDTLPLYYQSLSWPEHLSLGHNPKDILALCLVRYGGNWVLAGPGCTDSMLKIRRHSDPKYFNCYSVEIQKAASQHVNELGLILWLGPDETHGKEDRQAFLFDLFEQAYGLRVVVHEPGQMASLNRYGFQVAPGRMNELTFKTVRMQHLNKPNKPCFEHPAQSFNDLDQRYDYQFDLCLNSRVQALIVNKCGCLYAYFPRIYVPNATLPYCGQLIQGKGYLLSEEVVTQRRECAESIVGSAAVIRKEIELDGLCLRPCQATEYESEVSVTMWRPTGWQLYWSQKTSSLFDSAINGSLTPDEARLIQHFLETKNLSEVAGSTPSALLDTNAKLPQDNNNAIIFNDRYTYLVIKRKSNDTVVKAEDLVLSVNALFSRIGGLCSLYIGMTLAVLVEIIEFVYLSCVRQKQHSVDGSSPGENHALKSNTDKDAPIVHCGIDYNCSDPENGWLEQTDLPTLRNPSNAEHDETEISPPPHTNTT